MRVSSESARGTSTTFDPRLENVGGLGAARIAFPQPRSHKGAEVEMVVALLGEDLGEAFDGVDLEAGRAELAQHGVVAGRGLLLKRGAVAFAACISRRLNEAVRARVANLQESADCERPSAAHI